MWAFLVRNASADGMRSDGRRRITTLCDSSSRSAIGTKRTPAGNEQPLGLIDECGVASYANSLLRTTAAWENQGFVMRPRSKSTRWKKPDQNEILLPP